MNSDIRHLIADALRFSGVAALMLGGLLAFSFALTSDRPFENWETEANLPVLTENKHFDVLMMGISHARIFSRDHNHERVERTLDRSMINLAQGGGFAGLENQLMHLNYFVEKGNSAEHLVLVLSPMLMFNRNMDRTKAAFEREPFKADFFAYVAVHGVENRWSQLAYYTRSKLFWNWIITKPSAYERMDKVIAGLDSAAMARTMPSAYPAGLSEEVFARQAAVLEEILETAQGHGMKVTLMMPVALFGRWPGHERVTVLLDSLQPRHGFEILDLSEAYFDNRLYYDHHHLNTDGVEQAADTLRTVLDRHRGG